MKKIAASLLLASLLVSACRTAKKNKTNLKSMDTVSVSAFNNPMSIYRAAAPRLWNIENTRVALSFDYKEKTAHGQEWIMLSPYCYATDTLTLDAKGMKIESITIGHNDKPLKYTYDSSQLHIQLDKVYTKAEQVLLSIKYVAMPYMQSTGGSSAITDDRGLYFINTDNKIEGKPVQVWTQGETEANSHWLPTIDKPDMRTTVRLELTVPSGYKTLSNGNLISSMDNGTLRTDIWKTDKPIQIYAIMFAIGDFFVAKDKWKDREVNYYVEQAYAPYAKKMFQYTPEMIEFFSNATGVQYPWNKYSQVVVRDYVSGAMENTSASLFGEFMNQDEREYLDANHEDVVSHELFHQWFGDYVTAESWSNLTVNESFATYGEYLWRKHKYGLSYADELAWSDLQRYMSTTEYGDPVLVRFHYRDKEEMFDRISYQKGGAILHYMHQIMGDSAFYRSMQHYLTKNALQPAEATHWRLAVEEATGQDWNWFFDQWYLRAGHPVLEVNYAYDDAAGKMTVTVTQKQDELYQLPLKTALIDGTTKQVLDWNISKRKETFTYAYKNGQHPVIVPDVVHVLPGKITENKNYREWLVQMQNCDDYISQWLALKSIKAKDFRDKDAHTILLAGLNNKTASIRVAALETLYNINSDEDWSAWKSDVISLAKNDNNNTVRATAFLLLGNRKEKSQKEMEIEAVGDNSYMIAGNALYALNKADDSIGYAIAKKHLKGKANTNLDISAWSIIANKGSDADSSLFREYANKKSDADNRKHLTGDLTNYAMHTKNEQVFALCMELLAQKIIATENKSYRAYYAGLLVNIKESLEAESTKSKKMPFYAARMNSLKTTAEKLSKSEKEEDVLDVYKKVMK